MSPSNEVLDPQKNSTFVPGSKVIGLSEWSDISPVKYCFMPDICKDGEAGYFIVYVDKYKNEVSYMELITPRNKARFFPYNGFEKFDGNNPNGLKAGAWVYTFRAITSEWDFVQRNGYSFGVNLDCPSVSWAEMGNFIAKFSDRKAIQSECITLFKDYMEYQKEICYNPGNCDGNKGDFLRLTLNEKAFIYGIEVSSKNGDMVKFSVDDITNFKFLDSNGLFEKNGVLTGTCLRPAKCSGSWNDTICGILPYLLTKSPNTNWIKLAQAIASIGNGQSKLDFSEWLFFPVSH